MKKKIFITFIIFILYALINSKDTYAVTVYNYLGFNDALNQKQSVITIGNSIDFSSPITINYAVTVNAGSSDNAIRYSGSGNFITIANGGTLTLSGVVVDLRSYIPNNWVSAISISSGGKLIFDGSLIDCGSTNTGITVNSGGTAQMGRGNIVYGRNGIVVKGNGTLTFTSSSNMEFWGNYIGIMFQTFTGTCYINKSSIIVRENDYGINFESGTGTVNISNVVIRNNTVTGLLCKTGTINLSGGSIYSNTSYGVHLRDSNLNISGGTIYSNGTGVYIQSGYSGKLKMTGGTIQSNTNYAINHAQTADGNCTITGGTVSGYIYLAGTDNYVNTNSSYPTLSVKPSTYSLGRKLVKTASNTVANTELSKVTMAASGSWYKYVQNEYIVVWSGGNVIVKHVDQDGNELASELLNGSIGSAYTTAAKDIEGYALVTTPSNATGTYTSADITVTYVYAFIKGSITVTNVDNIEETKLLSGGTFKLEMLDADGNVDSTFTAVELTAGDDGTVIFPDVVPGKYRITQIKAIDGYNLNKNAVDVETTIDSIDAEVTVKNIAKVDLPETGDINYSLLISISGIVLILAALIINNLNKKNINKLQQEKEI